MKFFLPKYPALLKWLYPQRISRINKANSIYLTFDDGPVPEVTPWVLDELKKFNARATFFCIGENIAKHPDIFKRIILEGHTIGNHTHNHLDGWKTSAPGYMENIKLAEERISSLQSGSKHPEKEKRIESSPFFRPPYGKIKNSQARMVRNAGYKIVMWDVISGDYNQNFSAEKCYKNVTENAVPGSTIVLHDSIKAFGNLRVFLPRILDYYKEKGIEFRSLKDVP